MPIYAYRCSACGQAKDVLQKMSDPLLTECPFCGEPTFVKQVTAAGFQLKGSGWYVTDFRGDAKAKNAPEGAGAGEGGKSDSSGDGKGGQGQGDAVKGAESKGAENKSGDTSAAASPASTPAAKGDAAGGKSSPSAASAPAPSSPAAGGGTGSVSK